ncbi:uncharacterized protein SPPG_03599 [Spizellomyces punctatus DAOM BR117]|uniref:NADH-ubiquinone oxidoreductase 12 kDa subunit, mitochondrial n=1 Tax=Spizellomyces punctatus (strain DAOM BR117) TaxID=645134 RepID=A0A0L0HL74_SPIPD|nr:uncharacterized protein SPPG_03599 [Spizellomyces punctatus DAOM BR117]KND01808.1 hypothetical protein SPPG_03599 [Spizellomyces punctatus DAOM BR117]|eukprot:XP_016609847.1 hypothetical protein SPPG_03599 [Spizellomyces punctatus DAOM BR117]
MAATHEPMQISPMPTIDPDLNVYDRAAVVKSRDEFFREQMVRIQEVTVLRDKMRWCYRREGVNHLQNCRHLSQQYLDLMKEMRTGWIKPFKLSGPPIPERVPTAHEAE